MTWRKCLAAWVLALLAVHLVAPAALAQPVKVKIGLGGFTFAFLPVLAADSAGYFREEGLDVTLIPTGGGTNTMAAVLGGSVDAAGIVFSDAILAAAKNQKVVAIAPLMTQYASDAVVSRGVAAKAGITPAMPLNERLRRLKGMTLAISSRGSGIDKLWRYLLSRAGLDPDRDVTLTVVKIDQMYPALKAGQIDGFNTSSPANNRAVEEGLAVWVARPSQGEIPGLENFLYTVLAVKPDYAKAHRDTLAKIVKALGRANALIHDKPDQVGSLLKQRHMAQTDLKLLQAAVADQRAAYPAKMEITGQMFEQNVAFMTKSGDDVKKVAFTDVIDSSGGH